MSTMKTTSKSISKARRKARAATEKCYLLDLPGELRNHIYHYLKEDEHITYDPRCLEMSSGEEAGVKKMVPHSIHLTQTCRQLRQEYSPIYAADTTIHVSHGHMRTFMDLHLPFLARDIDGKMIGKLIIDWGSPTNTNEITLDFEPEVDVAPLLSHLRDNTSLQVQCGPNRFGNTAFATEWASATPDLLELFKTAQHAALGDAMIGAVVSININYAAQVNVQMKKGMMRKWVKEVFDQGDQEMRQVWRKTGFQFSAGGWVYEQSSLGII